MAETGGYQGLTTVEEEDCDLGSQNLVECSRRCVEEAEFEDNGDSLRQLGVTARCGRTCKALSKPRLIADHFLVLSSVHSSRINAAITEFKLPAMSPTMTEGSVGEWKFKEGEAFSASDVLMTVETDKGALLPSQLSHVP
jgi:hypothetical protein